MKTWFYSKLRSSVLAAVYVVVMMIPNIVLAFTEPYTPWARVAAILLPLGFYCWWSVWLRRSGIAIWLSFPFVFFGAFQIVLLYLFGNSIIATDMFTNLLTTNPDEAGELLGNIWPAILIVVAIYLPLLWVATVEIRERRMIPYRTRRWLGFPGVVIFLLGCAALNPAQKTSGGESVLKNDVFPINVFYNLKLSISEYGKMKRFEQTSDGFAYGVERSAKAPQREIYVFVIGEASRAMNWQLYGYERETNPELSKRDDIVVFRNMLTQSNTTHKSVPMILSSISPSEHDELFRRKGLPALFNEAGFETWFISNQAPQGAMIDKLASDADHVVYIDHPRMDMQMLDEMKRVIEREPDRDLHFILHCYGSHFSYHQRYPREFARFTPDDDVAITRKNVERIRNAYDNSICYTDHFLNSTIDYLNGCDACTALLYCADHGEDLFDDKRDRFLHASPTVTYYQIYVASLAWFSPAYREIFPEQAAAARSNEMAPANTHALFHTMADMASIASPYVDRGVSLLNPEFEYDRPRYYLDDHNQAEEYEKMGLTPDDLENFRRRGIEL